MPNAFFEHAVTVLTAYTEGAAPANSAPDWFPAAFPFMLAGMWILITTVLGWIGGHMALLARYPPVDEPKEEAFRWASGAMRAGVSFNNALYVGLGTRGCTSRRTRCSARSFAEEYRASRGRRSG